MTNHPPIETIRAGNIKASVWENGNQQGETYYAVTFAKTYRDSDGRLADTSAFVGADMLQLAYVANEAYAKTNALRQRHTHERDEPDVVENDRSNTNREFQRRSNRRRANGAAPQ